MTGYKLTAEQELSNWEDSLKNLKVKSEDDEKEYFFIKEKIEQAKDRVA